MNKGDLVVCVSDYYSEGKLLAAVVYEVERSWMCGGSEFLDLVGVPGPWAPERFKPYVGAYKTTYTAPRLTDPIGTVVTVDSETARRKAMPVCSGVLDYFPDALLAVSQLSKFGGDKYNPGEPLHWARGKSMDHADALVRHHMQRGTIDPDSGLSHSVGVAWRALAQLQQEIEETQGAPLSRGSRKDTK